MGNAARRPSIPSRQEKRELWTLARAISVLVLILLWKTSAPAAECNKNGVQDEVDVAQGTSLDANHNFIIGLAPGVAGTDSWSVFAVTTGCVPISATTAGTVAARVTDTPPGLVPASGCAECLVEYANWRRGGIGGDGAGGSGGLPGDNVVTFRGATTYARREGLTVRFCESLFHRGDANGDGRNDVSDAIAIFSFLFLGGVVPPPPGAPSRAPCGPDPGGAPGNLGCERYDGCG